MSAAKPVDPAVAARNRRLLIILLAAALLTAAAGTLYLRDYGFNTADKKSERTYH